MAELRHPDPKSSTTSMQQHAEHIPKALAGLAMLSIAAYFEGVLYIRAYFAEFEALWILDEVSMALFFEQSMIPLVLAFFLVVLAIMGLFDMGTKDQEFARIQLKASIAVITYGPWCALILGAIDFALSELDSISAAIVLSMTSVAMLLLLLASVLKLLLLWFQNPDIQFDRSMLLFSMAVLALGLYWVPSQLGGNFGKIDQEPAASTLPSINFREDSTEYKLLFSVNDRLYVFPAHSRETHPSIKTTSSSTVEFIRTGNTSAEH